MGVSNVNNQNAINMIKLALQSKTSKTAESSKPEYLKMTGSIFNAPEAKANKKTNATQDNLNNLNTLKSLNDLDGGKKTSDKQDLSSIDNAADGKKAAKQIEGESDKIKSQTQVAEKENKNAQKFSADAQKADKQIKEGTKKFEAQLQQQQAELKKNNTELQKVIQETTETQKEIDNAQHELDTLLASSSFTVGEDGTQTNPNQDKINELQTLIGSKASGMQQNGRVIYSLQRSQTRTLGSMNKTNAVFVKQQAKTTKAIQQKESSTQKIINTATKIEQISTLVAQGGQALNLAGQGLVALGSAMSGFFGVGAALIAAGTVMQKVGTVAEMVGNYGATAANLTKTAAYAAEGNLAGAMQSAASATMTGAAAVKQTKGLKDTFGQINANADQATQKLAANTAAKEQVEQTKNQAVKDLANQNGIDTKNMSNKEIEKALKENGVSGKEIKNAKKTAFGVDADGKTISAKQAKQAISADLQNRMNLDPKKNANAIKTDKRTNKFAQAKDIRGKLDDTTVSSSFEKAKASGFKNTTVTNTVKTSQSVGSYLEAFSKGLSTTAAVFGQNNNSVNNNTTNKPHAQQWDLSNNRQFQRIYASNRRYSA